MAIEVYLEKNINREKCNEIIKAIKEFAEKEMGC